MGERGLGVVPRPKSAVFGGGGYAMPLRVDLRVSAGAQGEVWAVKRCLRRAGRRVGRVEVVGGAGYFVTLGRPAPRRAPGGKPPKGNEGYVLTVRKTGVGIYANTAAGVYWGVQTLGQLLEDSTRVPVVRVDDYPDLAMRGLHLDMKGTFPKRRRLWQLVETLSNYKVNLVLAEYDEKIALATHGGFAAGNALSPAEARRFVRHCERHHVRVMPLFQCLGHGEYILRHARYAHLREVEDRYDQFCPSNPEFLEMLEDCLREIAALHAESEWFHVGMDETRALGMCPRCRRRVRKVGPLGLYTEHLRRVFEIVQGCGKRPVFWDDMLTRHGRFDLIQSLPGDFAVAYWNYRARDERDSCAILEKVVMSREWLLKGKDRQAFLDFPGSTGTVLEGGLPEDARKVYRRYRRYFETRESPLYFDSLPYVGPLKAAGVPVIGMSASRSSAQPRAPDPGAIRNVRTWARRAKREGLMGAIATSWARSNSNAALNVTLEDTWYATIGSAEFHWSADTDLDDYDRRFNRRFLGLDHTRATDVQYTLHATRDGRGHAAILIAEELKALMRACGRNRQYLAQVRFLARVEQAARFVRNVWLERLAPNFAPPNVSASLPGAAAPIRRWMREVLDNLGALRREGTRLYGRTMYEQDAHERIEALIRPLEVVLEAGLAEMERAARTSGVRRRG